MRIKPRKRLKREKPDALKAPFGGDETTGRFTGAFVVQYLDMRHSWGMQRGRAAAPLPRCAV